MGERESAQTWSEPYEGLDHMTIEAQPAQRDDRLAVVVGVLGAMWVAAHALGLLGPLDVAFFPVLVAGTVATTVYGVSTYKLEPLWVWRAGVLGLMLFLTSALLRESLGTLGDLSAERSFLPEPFAFGAYAALTIMVYGMAKARRGSRFRDSNSTLDAIIAGLAGLALAWIYLITPSLAQQEVSISIRIALALYPAVSIFLLTYGFRLAITWGRSQPASFYLVILALASLCAGDIVYMLVELNLVDVANWVHGPYGIAVLSCAVLMAHPSAALLTKPVPATEVGPRRGLAVVAVAVVVPGLVAMASPDTKTSDRMVLALIVVALMVATGVRVFTALRDHARSEARLAHLATRDQLTELPNWASIEEMLEEVLAHPPSHRGGMAVLFLDLDRFKNVNDTLGHETGDKLLLAVANRLLENVRATDVVARIGGDEFVIMLPTVRDEAEAFEIAERTRLMFGPPFEVGTVQIPVTASVGVRYVPPGEEVAAGTVMRDADTAMYASKEAQAATAVAFNERMHQRVTRRLMLEGEIRHAAERGELSLAYQPIVQTADGRITGLEALIRWDHPDLGRVPPTDFIPVCEEIGYIVDLGGWVLDEAVGHLAKLRKEVEHADQLSMAINVSVRQLREPRFTDLVARAVLKHGIPASVLCLEVTESLLVENLTDISETLSILRGFGVRIAIDDFGTGYSSLAYLRRLPVDEIKIDRQFTSGLGRDKADNSLVAAMIAMADALGFTIVAEGVETVLQQQQLVDLGCEHAQGYAFCPPVPEEELAEVFARLGLAAAPRLRVIRDHA